MRELPQNLPNAVADSLDLDWSSWVTGALTVVGVWLLAKVVRRFSRSVDDAIDRVWSRAENWVSIRHQQRKRARQERNQQKEDSKRLDSLKEERVGKRFRFRTSARDSGMLGEVVELDPRDAHRRVIVVWSDSPGRTATDDDYTVGQRVSIEWRHLTEAADRQRHRTARTIAQSFEDSDGWTQFERIDDGKPT